MQYKLVEADSSFWLEKQVNDLIAEGWRPLGGVNALRWEYENRKGDRDSAWWYTQAMIKEGANE